MTIILTDPTPTGPIPVQRAVVEHPSWCSPLHCTTTPDDDALLVTHRVVLLDEPGLLVEVVRGDVVCAHGGELIVGDPPAVRVVSGDRYTELTPEVRLAGAVAAAAEIAGGAR